MGGQGEWTYEAGKGWTLDVMFRTGTGTCKDVCEDIVCQDQGQRNEGWHG